MPKVIFKVLCSDSPQACDRVHTTLYNSGIQTDSNIKMSTEKGYEHIITTEFETLTKARKKAEEIKKNWDLT